MNKQDVVASSPPILNTQLVSLLFKHSPIGIYIISKHKFRYVNSKFEKITGYSFEELKNIAPTELIIPKKREEVRKCAISMLKGKRENPFLNEIRDKQGKIKYILESVCSVIYNGQRCVLGFFLDNTDEEIAKQQLKKSEEKFQKAFQLSPDWIVITTFKEGIYLEVNQAFLETTGYTLKEVIGKSSLDTQIWADPKQRDELYEILKAYGKIYNVEVKFKKKDGTLIDVLWSAQKIEHDHKECLISIAKDITEIKKAEQEKLTKEKLQGVLEMAGAACHEMNQPLQSVIFIVEEILEKYPDDKKCLELKRQIERLRRIIYKVENITTYSTKEYVKGIKIIDIDRASLGHLNRK